MLFRSPLSSRACCLSMIASENRCPPIGSWPEGMLFRIMLWAACRPLSPVDRFNAGIAVVPVEIRLGTGYSGSEYHSAMMNQIVQPMHG